ncbi:hypothetical protein SDC9_55186 [bioreactor metagenome]|uniref:Uncharacterized protein n=1 Tax=bioreactor metagenome TaxID=1076179 RepID=A0A644WY83_9ZZZZ
MYGRGGHLHGTAILPIPRTLVGPEYRRKNSVIDSELKDTGTKTLLPGRSPIGSIDIYMIRPLLGKLHGGHSIRYRVPQPMGQQIRSTHDRNELGIEHPTTKTAETSCRNQNICHGSTLDGTGCQTGDKIPLEKHKHRRNWN